MPRFHHVSNNERATNGPKKGGSGGGLLKATIGSIVSLVASPLLSASFSSFLGVKVANKPVSSIHLIKKFSLYLQVSLTLTSNNCIKSKALENTLWMWSIHRVDLPGPAFCRQQCKRNRSTHVFYSYHAPLQWLNKTCFRFMKDSIVRINKSKQLKYRKNKPEVFVNGNRHIYILIFATSMIT